MNKSDKNSSDPISQLEKQLLRASNDPARLQAYRTFLPDILAANPGEALRLGTKASLIAFELEDRSAQVEISCHIADGYLQIREAKKALAVLHEASELVDPRDAPLEATRIFTAIAKAYKIMSDSDQALAWHEKALAASPLGATPIRAEVLEGLAEFYSWIGRYDEAIGALRGALAIWEELDNPAGIGRALGEIGTGYGLMEDLATAYDYYQRSLESFQSAGDFVSMARALANMSSIHQSRGELSATIETAWRAHAACEEHGDWATSASLMITIATMHWRQGELDLALRHYIKAFNLLPDHSDDNLLLNLYRHIGGLHQETGDLDGAKHVYTQALKIADHLKELRAQMELHKALSQVHERQGHYLEALGHHRQFAGLQSRLASEEQRQATVEMQMKHTITDLSRKLEQAQQQIRQLREEKRILEIELVHARAARTGERPEKKKGRPSITRDKPGNGGDEAENSVSDASFSDPSLEWEKLEHDFEKIHPNFKKKLLEICPEITPTETKICILTKIFGNKSNEIAQILGNHMRTLQTQRYNIRKKLGLGEVNFVTYIQSL